MQCTTKENLLNFINGAEDLAVKWSEDGLSVLMTKVSTGEWVEATWFDQFAMFCITAFG